MAGTAHRREETEHELTWDRWIPVFAPRLIDTLAGAPALRRLASTASALPGSCLGAVEVRLAKDGPVDLSIRFEDSEEARHAVEVASPSLSDFLARWKSGELPRARVSALWLEFDHGLEGTAAGPPVSWARLGGRADPAWLTTLLLPALRGLPLARAPARLLRRCVEALPDGTRALYVGDLLPRGFDAVRLEVFGYSLPAIVDYVRNVAGEAAARRIRRIQPLVAACERFHLSLDLGAEIAPRIGVEASFSRLPHREPGWRALFDELVLSGLCAADRRDAVLRWPGYDSLWTAAESWPAGAEALGGHAVRCLSHVKVVSRPGRDPEAKAYLLFQHLVGRPSLVGFG